MFSSRASASTPIRVVLVSTAPVGEPGSMRAYADLLLASLRDHAPAIEARLLELDPAPARGRLARRIDVLSLPSRMRRRADAAADLWHVLDGSRAHLAAGLGSAAFVVTAHDIIPRLQQRGRFPAAPAQGVAARWLWRRNLAAMRSARWVVCVSESTRDDIVAEGVSKDRTSVVPLPVRPSLLAREASRARQQGVVLHVGNNAFYKGREQVLRVFARMDRALARRLVMVGPAPAPGMLDVAASLGIAEAVEWLQYADDGVLAECYASASLMLFPSLYEGFGWPVLEAMASGLPVVASNAGSLPEVVGQVAPCVAPDDIDGFVREAEALLRDPAAAASRADAGRLRARAFGMEALARETAAAYRAALELDRSALHRGIPA